MRLLFKGSVQNRYMNGTQGPYLSADFDDKIIVCFATKLWPESINRVDSKNDIGFGCVTLKIAVRSAFLNSQTVRSRYAFPILLSRISPCFRSIWVWEIAFDLGSTSICLSYLQHVCWHVSKHQDKTVKIPKQHKELSYLYLICGHSSTQAPRR